MKLARAIALLVAVLLVWSAAQPAQAQILGQGVHGFGHAGFYGYSSPYASGRIPTPPYFSIHPPVYYSAPIPRTYGYSPYAYPGSVRTPELSVAAPEMIHNPHAKPAIQKVDSKVKVASVVKPLLVVNPYATKDRTQLAAAQVY